MCTNRKQRSPLLSIHTRIQDESLCAEISDTGPGIPDELRFRIFEPFFSNKSHQYGGNGLGLTRAQEIVNSHAGTLDLDLHYHQGARFIVRLPIHPASSL